jgi:probable phosphoglycerate mutase
VGPVSLMLVRHAESVGNVAREHAMAVGAEVIDIDQRDADVPLSARGAEQASALGRWLAGVPADDRPQSAWASPYLRAGQTAAIALQTASLDLTARPDERLRDRDLGVLDRLTTAGIDARFPDEGQRRRLLGKLYYRPLAGESWADVALRVRSLLADLERVEAGRRVVLFAHDAVILLVRYVCEELTESALLEIGRTTTVANTSVTRLVRPSGSGPWRLAGFNDTGHLGTGAGA